MQTLNSPSKEVVNLQTSFLHHCKLFHEGSWSHLKTTNNKQHSVCLVWNDYLNSRWKNVLVNRLNFQHFTKLRWLNTVLWAVSGNLRDGACFKLDKQTWWRKSNGTQKTISQNLLIRMLLYLAEFFLLSYFK